MSRLYIEVVEEINVYIIHIKETKEKPISYLLAGKKIFQI
jgi:hypothetical protein